MNERIFRLNFLASLLVLLVSFAMVFGVLFEYYEKQMLAELESEAEYITYAVENEGISYIENLEKNNKRITLISSDGTVLFDTSAPAAQLDNHADRAEIMQAAENGSGSSTRYSNTLMQKNLYYAQKLENGNILRISTTQNSVITILLGLLYPLIFIIVIALIISLLLSHRVSKSIVKPINALDLDNPSNNDTYDELTPLLRKLSAQRRTIDRQIKEAKQKQEEFRLITENMSEGLLVIDARANVLSYNRAAVRLLEIDGINNKSVLAFNRTREFRSVVEKALEGERTQGDITLDERIYSLVATPVFDNEKIIGAVIVIIDITENARREQLRREFTSNVSHELKTPLTSISGFAEMMKAGGMPEETVTDFSTSIYDEAQRLITLVSDIMKISELDEKSVQLKPEKIDLLEAAKDVVKRLNSIASKHSVTLNVSGETAYVSGTRKILDEMIYNLCDNAIKYNKENGSVDIVIDSSDDKTSITVKDTGIGIAQSEQNRVFERFYRVDKSHSKLVGGTGLGLAIVKHAAAYHNAEISLESVPGEGTSVKICFEKCDL